MANDINMLEDIGTFQKLKEMDVADDLSRCYRDRYINADESRARKSKQDFISYVLKNITNIMFSSQLCSVENVTRLISGNFSVWREHNKSSFYVLAKQGSRPGHTLWSN